MQIKNFTYFYPERAQLMLRESNAFNELSKNENWIAEPKYNGSRCVVHILDGEVSFYSRHGESLKYNEDPDPDIVGYLKSLFNMGYYQFDGELRHNKVKGIRDKLVIWDCFIYENVVLNRMPYWKRQSLCSIFPVDREHQISLIERYDTDFDKAFESVIKDSEMEGLVLKKLNGELELCRTSSANSKWQYKVRKKTNSYRY